MALREYTDSELEELRTVPKRVSNPDVRWTKKPRIAPVHRQRSFRAVGEDAGLHFEIYQRQNLSDPADYSCGIALVPLGGARLTLARYNGPSHEHGDIHFHQHIHRASATAISTGKRPEREATETDRYDNLEEALFSLAEDFNVSGLHNAEEQRSLL